MTTLPALVLEIEKRHARVKAKCDEWLAGNCDVHPMVTEMPITIFDANDALRDRTDLLRIVKEMQEALRPFGLLGLPFIKADECDTSTWTEVPDARRFVVGATDLGWNGITVGDLRRAAQCLAPQESTDGR